MERTGKFLDNHGSASELLEMAFLIFLQMTQLSMSIVVITAARQTPPYDLQSYGKLWQLEFYIYENFFLRNA